jgi:hypothetical protein
VLVVMVIIAILVGLTVTVVGNAIGSARVAGTRGTIMKVHGLVAERVRAIDQAVHGQAFRSRLLQKQSQLGGSAELALAVVMKDELKRAFYRKPDGSLNYPPAVPVPPPNPPPDARLESSKMLHFALTQGSVHGLPPVDTDTFSSSEVRIDPLDQRAYFVDAWGEPLRFYLFPTRLVRPGGYDPTATSGQGAPVDPDDPTHPNFINRELVNLLMPGLTRELLSGDPQDANAAFAQWATQAAQDPKQIEVQYHTLVTYHLPLIVSSGADRELGLYEPYEVDTNAGHYGHLAQPKTDLTGDGTDDWQLTNPGDGPVNDNVSSHQRAGGN